MKGDVLFYEGEPNSLICDLIRWRTGGPFVHVEIDMGDGTAIGALTKGVSRHALVSTPYVFNTSSTADDSHIEAGLTFLKSKINCEYGWNDIVDAVLPPWWKLVLKDGDAFDCSHLATQYLMTVGAMRFPRYVLNRPQSVTPNSLAIFCRVIPIS